MATLTLSRGGQVIWSHQLEGHCNRIGRDPQVDIVLADPGVSRLHAVIYEVEGGHRLIDNSTNGTRINDRISRVCRLAGGDTIEIGPYQLEYQGGDGHLPSPLTIPTGQTPAVIGYHAARERFITSQDLLIVRDQDSEPFAWTLGERSRIGAAPSNDLVITGPDGLSCEIAREGNTYRVVASGGQVRINGQQTSTAIVKRGSTIEIGHTELELVTEEGEEAIEPLREPIYEGMVGSGPQMQRLFAMIERVAPMNDPVIVLGETGTGKELVARALHNRSERSKKPFVALNCGAINKEIAESELFGHVRGAFTGADRDRDGAFHQAHGGTLFLDEIGELPLELQVKLLRLLETGKVSRVGEHSTTQVDVRIVCATHRDLFAEVQGGRFRSDLFFRLFVIPLQLPPLRERLSDLPHLTHYFLNQAGQRRELTEEAWAKLRAHPWAGNIRELRHLLTRATAVCPSGTLDASDLPLLIPADGQLGLSGPLPHLVTLEEMERTLIARAVKEAVNRKEAAKMLGIARSTLHVKLKKYGL